ncbi:family 1 glycosylhydrolase [Microvirga lotononidis]|uniref:Beta-glucosidase/6-phospho-beta-glucosidase/beta-galactosidase n=1 Tax=Microvirga lotononidis TaxID=864069 RepID=I4Z1K0_9HYPH|nr:family 1 glycosylhydrolase [Microvirga lotononidis]EIM30092.1 beta-glucosidase/6-phospho-beta-glucosidase/beta-galactosidase [Microvirga lotononidis]WQO31867.1 family 1 glycosylhydrolase [Microvirga lotononidis]
MTRFMFATGIENSYPTIDGGRTRRDQLEECHHYERWRDDFDLVEDLGIHYLRYGPPMHLVWLGDGRYDWGFTDQAFADLKRRNIVPIVDLCHFGVPDWIGDFQNPDFPELFERYARDFARRFPWVQLYTPVNEMFICAVFSAKYGWWNEQLTSDQAFVTALKVIAKANVLAMQAILDVRPDALFIQSESSEYFHADSPEAIAPAEFMNALRFLALDLNYGIRVNAEMYRYLMDNGMTPEEYDFFLHMRLKAHCIMGNDYYVTNEHRIWPDGTTRASGEVFGYAVITHQYYQRYGLPIMHTETNFREGLEGDEAVLWLWKEWANVLHVRNAGHPIVGFTWYSLTDQVDWDSALRERNNRVNPLGLYELDRSIRPVGRAYKELIAAWREVLPVFSLCLQVPVGRPRDFDEPLVQRAIEEARQRRVARGERCRAVVGSVTRD